MLDKCVKNSKIKPENVSETVIAGGTCRIPYIQEILHNYLNKKMNKKNDLTKSLNMDEHIANGCSYYAMILDEKWNYQIEIHDKEMSNDLLIFKDRELKNITMKIREDLGKTIHSLYTPVSEIIKRDLIIDEIEKECKLIITESKDSEKDDTYNFILKNIEYSTDTTKADKLRNEIEQNVYDYQHDLDLIADKQYVEIQKKYLDEVISTLHSNVELKIYNKAHEFEREFNQNWLKRKADLKELAITYMYLIFF